MMKLFSAEMLKTDSKAITVLNVHANNKKSYVLRQNARDRREYSLFPNEESKPILCTIFATSSLDGKGKIRINIYLDQISLSFAYFLFVVLYANNK